MSEAVFIDSSFWIALRDAREPGHDFARDLLARLFRQRTLFVLTLPVFGEIHAYFSRSARLRQQVLADFWNNPVARIEAVPFSDLNDAVELLRQHPDKAYSLCDAISFVVMRRLQLRRVLTFDHHFMQFGEFQVVA
jgi:predicted nucleic acid-binding protein